MWAVELPGRLKWPSFDEFFPRYPVKFVYHGRMRLFLLAATSLLVAACSQEDPSRPRSTNGASGASSSSSSGETGGSGSGSAGGSGGAAGGGGAGGVDAGTGPTEPGPSDPPCTNDLAYWALGMSFAAPTPQALGLALNELAYASSTHPISIVLTAKGGVSTATVGISATADNGMGLQVFPTGTKPAFVPAFLSYGGFQTNTPQLTGVLHLVDAVGSVDIELNNIIVRMTTSSGCSNVLGVLDAEIPTSESGKTLHLKAGDSTIGELGAGAVGGEKDAGSVPILVRGFFTGETMSFDFASLK